MSSARDETPPPDRVRTGTVEPAEAQPRRPLLGKLLAVLVALGCAAYLANLGFGTFAEIPDFLPGVGNLDEATATAILVSALAYLGIRLPFLSSRPPRSRR